MIHSQNRRRAGNEFFNRIDPKAPVVDVGFGASELGIFS
jgi:hypothetical protein